MILDLYDAAIAAAAPGAITTRAIDGLGIDRARRVWIYAIGKAAYPMATAAVTALTRSMNIVVGGIVVGAETVSAPYPSLAAMHGDHPAPGRNSFAAAERIAETAGGRRGTDVAVVLLSGGASSLIGAPLRGMGESDLTLLYELLLGSGLDIASMNIIRKRFSRWGAGRLALALAPAAIHCLAISDVAGDELSVIGSGPCMPDASTVKDVSALLAKANLTSRISETHRSYLASVTRGTIPETLKKTHPAFAHVSARVIGNNRMAIDGAAARARAQSLEPRIVDAWLDGDAAQAGAAIAHALLEARGSGGGGRCIVWGGETTVTLRSGSLARPSGGGRCQELALAAARVLSDAGDAAEGIQLLAAGTDGRDGATDAAGAIVDARTWSAALAGGRDPAQSLAAHESNAALGAADALIPRRDTGTNVNDVVIGLL